MKRKIVRDLKIKGPNGTLYERVNVVLPAKRRVRAHRLPVKLYKVVTGNLNSLHGGSLNWQEPKNGKPGPWHAVTGRLGKCMWGLHVTVIPRAWKGGPDYSFGNYRVFEVEVAGAIHHDPNDDKLCVRAVRLVRELENSNAPARRVLKFSRTGTKKRKAITRALRKNPKLHPYLGDS